MKTLKLYRNPKTGRYSTTTGDVASGSQWIDSAGNYSNDGEKHVRRLRSKLNKPCNHPAFEAMAAVVGDVVTHYHCDFYKTDRLHLEAFAPSVFLWTVRDTGTHIVSGNGGDWDRAIMNNAHDAPKRYFIWRLGKLTELADVDAFRSAYAKHVLPLVRKYRAIVGSDWRGNYHAKSRAIEIESTRPAASVASDVRTGADETVVSIFELVKRGDDVLRWHFADDCQQYVTS